MIMALQLLVMQGQTERSRLFHAGDGFFYHRVNQRRSFTHLRCVRARRITNPCDGTAKAVLRRGLLFHLNAHNHVPNVHYPGAVALRRAIKNRIKAGDRACNAEILHEEGRRFPFQVRAQLPLPSIESGLNKIRSNLTPPVPESLLELGMRLTEPRYWPLTQCFGDGQTMFAGVCGSEAEQTLSLVFISDDIKEFMQGRSMVFADGTERKKFKKPLNAQIFSIYSAWGSHGIPMLRAIMSRKSEVAYLALFNFIKLIMPRFRPTIIMCDFEDAQTNAWQTAFPNAEVTGCLWHYDVAVLRHAKVILGLQPLVAAEPVVASIMRASLALPLLPTDEILDGLYDLGNEALERGWMDDLRPYFLYLDREWVPKIPILSVFDAPHRTNNVSETGNRAFNKIMRGSRPGCFHVIGGFVQLNEKALVELEAIGWNRRVVRRRKLSVLRNDRRIRQLYDELRNGDINRLQFLHRASRRMQNVFMRVMNLRY